MTYDVDALAKAAQADTDMRIKMLESGNHLGVASMLNAAFLCGWRYAIKSQADGEGKP